MIWVGVDDYDCLMYNLFLVIERHFDVFDFLIKGCELAMNSGILLA